MLIYTFTTYGIIFWGNSAYSDNIFRLKKRITKILIGVRTRYWSKAWFESYLNKIYKSSNL